MQIIKHYSDPGRTNKYIESRGWNIPIWTYYQWYRNSGDSAFSRHRCKNPVVKTADWKEANPGHDLYILCAAMLVADLTSWHLDHIIPKSKGGLHHHSNIRLVPGWANIEMGNKSWSHEVLEDYVFDKANWPKYTRVPEWWRSLPVEEFLDIIPFDKDLLS